MNFLTKYKVKTNYIKLDLMVRDIANIHSNVESPYVVPKRYLAEARNDIYVSLKKAVRSMKKAKGLFIEESSIAYEYNRYKEIIEETKDEKLLNMNSRYLKAIHEGDYKTAKQIVLNMSASHDVVEPPSRLKLTTESTNDRSAIIVAENEFDTNLLITNFNILSDETTESDVHGTLLIQGREKVQIGLRSDTDIRYPVKISVTYSIGNEDKRTNFVVHRK